MGTVITLYETKASTQTLLTKRPRVFRRILMCNVLRHPNVSMKEVVKNLRWYGRRARRQSQYALRTRMTLVEGMFLLTPIRAAENVTVSWKPTNGRSQPWKMTLDQGNELAVQMLLFSVTMKGVLRMTA